MIRELQDGVVFSGRHYTSTDSNGRLWIPKPMCCNPTDLGTHIELPLKGAVYLRKEVYGIYATLLSKHLYDYAFAKDDDDSVRINFFADGKFATIRDNGGEGDNGSRRITLGKPLASLEVVLEGQAHFFRIIPDFNSLRERGMTWETFEFGKHTKDYQEE